MKFYTDITLHKGKIYHSGYENGKKFITKQGFKPTLGIQCNEETGYKSLMGNNIKPINFDSIAEFNKYKKEYKDVIELHGNISPIYQFISEKYKGDCNFSTKDIRVFLYDIETIDETKEHKGFPKPENAPVPVVSIALKDIKTNVMFLLSLKDYDPNYKLNELKSKKVIHKKCVSERHLLKTFVNIFKRLQPDLLVGYNNRIFDDPYILHRIEKICGFEELKELSPIKQVYYSFDQDKYGKIKCNYNIKGLQILDYLELYKKFIPQGRESFSLSFISQFELGDDKVDYSEHDNIVEFYIEDPVEFLFYNIRDVELIELLDDKLKLLDLVFTIAYMAKINYEDVMSPIRTWDSIIYEHLKEKNIFIPPDKHEERVSYAGAYVHDPEPGIYDWVVSYDLNSLYPHIIMQWNISPETLIEDKIESVNQHEIDERFLNQEIIPDEKYILSGSGYYFSKTQDGFLPYLMEQMYESRVKVKNEMKDLKKLRDDSVSDQITALNNKQLTLKVLLNS
jgi:DNA polymerase elongation subunit (family B)